ncbi:MAG: hypothetical protein HND44_14890 [Chloroflexi bacterium]|nr:hypothetical protein [Ardenticatenaceae bacterium]NOG35832.1 hypothetical protein [Chloroflexota bacterium]GIK57929.1 MAG: hypothetical protein BroJett015_35920 [Chloroflexota bacterium]
MVGGNGGNGFVGSAVAGFAVMDGVAVSAGDVRDEAGVGSRSGARVAVADMTTIDDVTAATGAITVGGKTVGGAA